MVSIGKVGMKIPYRRQTESRIAIHICRDEASACIGLRVLADG
jgi:hypothetical protein